LERRLYKAYDAIKDALDAGAEEFEFRPRFYDMYNIDNNWGME